MYDYMHDALCMNVDFKTLFIYLYLQQPNSANVSRNFTYKLVKNGTVVLVAKTDQRGYTAGQVIKVSTQIDNQSAKSTGHVVACLMQVRIY